MLEISRYCSSAKVIFSSDVGDNMPIFIMSVLSKVSENRTWLLS